MTTANKVKAGAAIAAILCAVLFLAYYFGAFGGGDVVNDPQAFEPPMTQEEQEEIQRIQEEQIQFNQRRGIPSVGS